jgi:hypothetical protein
MLFRFPATRHATLLLPWLQLRTRPRSSRNECERALTGPLVTAAMLAPAKGAIAELAFVLLLGRRAGFASRGGRRRGRGERHGVGGGHLGGSFLCAMDSSRGRAAVLPAERAWALNWGRMGQVAGVLYHSVGYREHRIDSTGAAGGGQVQ